MPTLRLDTPLFEALGAKNVFLKRLERLGVKTVGDLLRHFPSRYEDFSHIVPIAELSPGEETTAQGVVQDVRVKYTRRRGLVIVEAVVADESGSIRAVWFNQPYLANSLRVGRTVNLAGKISVSDEGDIYFNNPSHEIISETSGERQETWHTGRLVPIYPETRGLTSRGIRFIVTNLLKRSIAIGEWIPDELLARYDLPEIGTAYRTVHFPADAEEAHIARRRFAFEDLFLLQLVNLKNKLALAEEKAAAIPVDIERLRTVTAGLPFELTPSQKRSLWEIVQDMARPQPMNRLLQGDVGSGKTIVAALAAMAAAEHGYQTAFMAPTEILAQQHFQTFQKFFGDVPAKIQPIIGLITANSAILFYENDVVGKIKKEDFWKKAAAGEISIIFGTHALLQKQAKFKDLGLVIVDEQHRFGVKQRQALLDSHKSAPMPHFLSMSATPIPRTLMMTVFGDLDVSLITELPAGRRPIETRIIKPHERVDAYAFIRKEVQAGRQVFVICPRIDTEDENPAGGTPPLRRGGREGFESENSKTQTPSHSPFAAGGRNQSTLELKSVKEEYEKLSKRIFPDLRVAMLHGKMKAKEKESVMRDFTDGKTDILVATSVIEVGVDIPNATVMAIEGADRFGLAQLYQFRGRVGRGAHQSHCLLFTDSESDNVKARLSAIMSAKNGFELAEKDLAIRGPGEFFGEAQSGFSDAAIEALRDPELVKMSREAAADILQHDPAIQAHPPLRDRLTAFRKTLHME